MKIIRTSECVICLQVEDCLNRQRRAEAANEGSREEGGVIWKGEDAAGSGGKPGRNWTVAGEESQPCEKQITWLQTKQNKQK